MDFATSLARLYAAARPQYPVDRTPQQKILTDRYRPDLTPEQDTSSGMNFNSNLLGKTKGDPLADPTVDIGPGEGGSSAEGGMGNLAGALAIIYAADQVKKGAGREDIPYDEKTTIQKATSSPGSILGLGGAPWFLTNQNDANFISKMGKLFAQGESQVFQPISDIISWLGFDL
jgi:hypothetical protein